MKNLSLLFVLGLLAFGIFFFYQFYIGGINYALNSDSSARVTFDVKKGSTASAVADQLAEEGLIKSPLVFKLYLKQNDLSDQIKAGRVILQEDFDLKQIVDSLLKGGSDEISVTLLEGWTIEQIAEYLEEMGLTTVQEFMSCVANCSFEFDFLPSGYLEGYLYPDTYFVNLNSYDNDRFITRLIQTLENRLDDEDFAAVESSGRTFEEIMIMASIVEREERDPDERPVIAGILWDRFDNQVGLGADATVLYALGRTKGGLTYDDLQVDSPYNTRKYRGLPPTPIANPSISSIRAAIYPKKTEYFYYLHGPDGQVHYGKTLDEHNENKAKYL
jgi:UPF0755 protein